MRARGRLALAEADLALEENQLSHNRSWLRGPLAFAVIGLLVLAACSGASPSPTENPDTSEPPASEGTGGTVEGFVSIHGSSTVEPISSNVAEKFAALF